MALKKEDGADLRKRYPLFVEGGLILALLILIAAFRVDFSGGPKKTFAMQDQETVDIQEVQQTQQQKQPPPPPRPPVPIEKPDDEVLEDQDLNFDATFDLQQNLTDTPVQSGPPEPEEEEQDEVIPFVRVEEQPEMIGGQEALYSEVNYPSFAQRAGIQGSVYLQFIVTKEGNVRDITVVRSPNDVLTEPAIEAMSKMKFTPGKQRTQPVEVRMQQRVTFRLE